MAVKSADRAGQLLRLTISTRGINRAACGSIGSTSPSRLASSRVAPCRRGCALEQDQRPGLKMRRDPRRDRVRRHVPACRKESRSGTFNLVQHDSRSQNWRQSRIPRGGQHIEPLDHDRTRQQPRQNGRGQVERVHGEPVGGCVAESVDPIERANPVRRGTPPGDQNDRVGGICRPPSLEKRRQPPGKLGPAEQAASNLDDRHPRSRRSCR